MKKYLLLLLFIPLIFSCDNNDENNSGIEITIQISGEDSIKDKDAIQIINKRLYSLLNDYPKIEKIDNNGRFILNISKKRDKFKFRDNNNTDTKELEGWSEFEIKRIKDLIEARAQLEFWDTFKGEEFGSFIFQANDVLKELVDTEVDSDGTPESAEDAISDIIGDTDAETGDDGEVNPLIDLIKRDGYNGGPVIAYFEQKDKQLVTDYLNNPQVRALLSAEQRYAKFVWGIPQVQQTIGEDSQNIELVELYALKGNRDNTPPLSGAVITDARQAFQQNGSPSVSMQMNLKGAKVWEEMTGNAFNTAGQIAIVLDEIVYSAPGVTTGPIAGGNSEISGSFTLNEAVDLANVLRSGAISKSIKIIDIKGGYQTVDN